MAIFVTTDVYTVKVAHPKPLFLGTNTNILIPPNAGSFHIRMSAKY